MSITIIPNQPIRFQNEDDIDTSCDCLGQGFCQLVNKNDATQFQIEATGDLVTNGTFDENLDGWEDNGSWQWVDGVAAHINESGLGDLEYLGILEIGKFYIIRFTMASTDEDEGGGVVIDSFAGGTEYEDFTSYEIIGKAISTDLIFSPFYGDGGSTYITIDDVEVIEIPAYTIKDENGVTVFTLEDTTGVTSSGDIVQYEIDWSDFDDGCYQIYISDVVIDYVSDCLTVKLTHDCTFLLSWTNDENAYGFDYANLDFTPKLRVEAKKWKPSYPKEKNVFKDNAGNRTILKSETSKEEILTISEMPEYLHDALAIGLDHDSFMIDGVEYVNEETEYTPKWRNSSHLAPSEVVVIKDQYLRNSSC
jgi:hypothetical protein